jgi:carboxyl-terminal processing protease
MKMLRYTMGFVYSVLSLGGGLFLGYSMVHTAWSLGKDPYKDFDVFTHVFHIIENKHVETPSSESLIHSAIDGMVEQLDEHSQYIPPEKYKIVKQEADGWSVGIGIELNTEHTILRVIPSSPAAVSGLMVGDQIIHIDQKSIKKKSLKKIQHLLKGERGSLITLTFLRDGNELSKEVIRDNILINVVEVFDLEDHNVYIQLNRFTKGCVSELRNEVQELYQLHKLHGVILDLRDNPGGFVEEGVKLVDLFLEEGLIIDVVGREERHIESYHAEKNHSDIIKAKLIILINGNSASAAELSAGALQANKRAVLIGTKSFGKGSMQQIYEFENGGALKLTISRYLLPEERQIDRKKPLIPDILVSNQLEDPKKELINTIKSLNIDNQKKQLIIQRLSMLQNNRASAPIPRTDDFQYRLNNDPQLKAAWNHLINNSSSRE